MSSAPSSSNGVGGTEIELKLRPMFDPVLQRVERLATAIWHITQGYLEMLNDGRVSDTMHGVSFSHSVRAAGSAFRLAFDPASLADAKGKKPKEYEVPDWTYERLRGHDRGLRIRQKQRITPKREKPPQIWLTVKGPAISPTTRKEWDQEVDPWIWDLLWRHTMGFRLSKIRYLIPHGKYTIELDRFTGELEGLWIAEIEFPSEAEAAVYIPPPWLGPCVDVTSDIRHRSRTLAETSSVPPVPLVGITDQMRELIAQGGVLLGAGTGSESVRVGSGAP